jgi:hypothetical protein
MAKHTPAEDNSFALSLAKHGAAAVALVVVVAAAFWGVGRMGEDTAEPAAAGQETGETPTPDAGGASTPPAEDTPTPSVSDTPASTPSTAGPSVSATPTASEATATETPSSEQTNDGLDPASISVQVLDAVRDDAGVGAQGWADQLEADGYDVIVINTASVTYARTTVFYTPGNEAAARQIAAQYGFTEVDLRPDNLSDSVDIHLVVGQDS